MRLAPIALRWAGDPEEAVSAARAQSVTTYGTRAAVEGCALLADILAEATLPATRLPCDGPGQPSNRQLRRSLLAPGGARNAKGSGRAVMSCISLEAALWRIDRQRQVFRCGAARGQPRRLCGHRGGGHWANRRCAMRPEVDTVALARSAGFGARKSRAERDD